LDKYCHGGEVQQEFMNFLEAHGANIWGIDLMVGNESKHQFLIILQHIINHEQKVFNFNFIDFSNVSGSRISRSVFK